MFRGVIHTYIHTYNTVQRDGHIPENYSKLVTGYLLTSDSTHRYCTCGVEVGVEVVLSTPLHFHSTGYYAGIVCVCGIEIYDGISL